MIHQNSMRFYNDIAYDKEYNGLVLDEDEGQLFHLLFALHIAWHGRYAGGIHDCFPPCWTHLLASSLQCQDVHERFRTLHKTAPESLTPLCAAQCVVPVSQLGQVSSKGIKLACCLYTMYPIYSSCLPLSDMSAQSPCNFDILNTCKCTFKIKVTTVMQATE